MKWELKWRAPLYIGNNYMSSYTYGRMWEWKFHSLKWSYYLHLNFEIFILLLMGMENFHFINNKFIVVDDDKIVTIKY